jgi:hypothetical protein
MAGIISQAVMAFSGFAEICGKTAEMWRVDRLKNQRLAGSARWRHDRYRRRGRRQHRLGDPPEGGEQGR